MWLWFTRCCNRHEGAERVDKWLKYASSVGVSLLLCISSFYICAILVGQEQWSGQTGARLHGASGRRHGGLPRQLG